MFNQSPVIILCNLIRLESHIIIYVRLKESPITTPSDSTPNANSRDLHSPTTNEHQDNRSNV